MIIGEILALLGLAARPVVFYAHVMLLIIQPEDDGSVYNMLHFFSEASIISTVWVTITVFVTFLIVAKSIEFRIALDHVFVKGCTLFWLPDALAQATYQVMFAVGMKTPLWLDTLKKPTLGALSILLIAPTVDSLMTSRHRSRLRNNVYFLMETIAKCLPFHNAALHMLKDEHMFLFIILELIAVGVFLHSIGLKALTRVMFRVSAFLYEKLVKLVLHVLSVLKTFNWFARIWNHCAPFGSAVAMAFISWKLFQLFLHTSNYYHAVLLLCTSVSAGLNSSILLLAALPSKLYDIRLLWVYKYLLNVAGLQSVIYQIQNLIMRLFRFVGNSLYYLGKFTCYHAWEASILVCLVNTILFFYSHIWYEYVKLIHIDLFSLELVTMENLGSSPLSILLCFLLWNSSAGACIDEIKSLELYMTYDPSQYRVNVSRATADTWDNIFVLTRSSFKAVLLPFLMSHAVSKLGVGEEILGTLCILYVCFWPFVIPTIPPLRMPLYRNGPFDGAELISLSTEVLEKPNNIFHQSECPICMESMIDEDHTDDVALFLERCAKEDPPILVLPCGHMVHQECFINCLNMSMSRNRCMTCRASLTYRDAIIDNLFL